MQAILVLYFADTLAHSGLGMSAGTAASVSAASGTLVHLVSVAGGRLAACGHYATDDHRRDAGFALCYLAIDIGAFAGPLITGRLGDHQGRHRGFSAAAIDMTFGLIQYVRGRRHLAGRRRPPSSPSRPRR